MHNMLVFISKLPWISRNLYVCHPAQLQVSCLTFVKDLFDPVEPWRYKNEKYSASSNCTQKQQECIPVGCVPPAHWSYLRISSYPTHASQEQPCTPPQQQPCTPPLEQPRMPPLGATTHAPPGATTHAPPSNHAPLPPGATMHAPPREQPSMPPLWTEWQTGVKILPCPKLRLRAVNTHVCGNNLNH